MKFRYRQWVWGWLILGLGFDPEELTMLDISLMACPQHREFTLKLQLLGVSFDFWITEPLNARPE